MDELEKLTRAQLIAVAGETALTLRNTAEVGTFQVSVEQSEDPYVEEVPSRSGNRLARKCIVQVADGQTFCIVPPYSGRTMRSQADAIARAGAIIILLLRMVEQMTQANRQLSAQREGVI